MMTIFRKFRTLILMAKGYMVFGKKVGVIGNFYVGNRRNVTIGDFCGINKDVFILGQCRISIGSRVVLSARCMLIDSGLDVSQFADQDFPPHVDGPITIEDDVWIGAGAIILPGVTVGRKSVVGAGSVVTRDVPPFTVVAGNPARRVRDVRD